MLQLAVSWLFAALALLLAARLFDGVRLDGDLATALGVSAVFALLSFLLGWLIFGLLGLATLGLGFVFHVITRVVVAAIVLKLTSAVSRRFKIEGFLPAIGTALLLTLASELAVRLVGPY